MYKCCLCGTAYESKEVAVDCVNRCGRKAHDEGKFISKESKYGGERTEVKFDLEDMVNDIFHLDVILLIDKMLEVGAPKSQVAALRDKVLADWNEIDNTERADRFKRVLMAAKLYGIEIPNK